MKREVEKHVEGLLKQGVLRKSTSPWASPIQPIRKKDGKLRLCVDYRALNKITKKNAYPLPRPDELLDQIGRCKPKFVTTLDMPQGYHQIPMAKDAIEKTACICHMGLFEYLRLPFGLTAAPAVFVKIMAEVLKDFGPDEGVFNYLDDVMIVSSTLDDHLQTLEKLFTRLKQCGILLKPEKCMFLRDEVKFLGHIITADGVKCNPELIEKILNFPRPTNVLDLRRFLGLCSYYRRFIQDFGKIAGPLVRMTAGQPKGKIPVTWNDEQDLAFRTLVKCLTTPPVLAFPDLDKPFVIEVDASHYGFGAVLCQQKVKKGPLHPVAYASRAITLQEAKGSAIMQLEAKAVLWALKQFRHFVMGRDDTIVFTDHKNLVGDLKTIDKIGLVAFAKRHGYSI